MSQQGIALLWGFEIHEGTSLDNIESLLSWHDENAPEVRVYIDDNADSFGMMVARQTEGRGVPLLPLPLDLGSVETTEPLASSLARAKQAWASFSTWCAELGVHPPAPRLLLVSFRAW